jgi:hypothetical protein
MNDIECPPATDLPEPIGLAALDYRCGLSMEETQAAYLRLCEAVRQALADAYGEGFYDAENK